MENTLKLLKKFINGLTNIYMIIREKGFDFKFILKVQMFGNKIIHRHS